MREVTIRLAGLDDIQVISDLCRQLFTEMATLQPDNFISARPAAEELEKFITGEQSAVFLAESNGLKIGAAIVLEQHTPPYPMLAQRKFAFLIDLVVDQAHRRQGIGQQLLSRAKEWAKERGLSYLTLNVLPENAAAIALYAREGFFVQQHTMHHRM